MSVAEVLMFQLPPWASVLALSPVIYWALRSVVKVFAPAPAPAKEEK